MSAGSRRPGLVAITGATGFLGQHLVRAFADARWRVRILARRDPISQFWRGLAPEVIHGDLDDEAALARLCEGADVVVHAAGLISGRARDLQRVNVDGARRLAAAARASHVLLISSLAAREARLSAYAASKRAGEMVSQEILGRRLTIVRPPAVYGPGDRETLRLFALAASSPVLPVLDPAARVALVHVQDAARQVVSLADTREMGPVALCDDRPDGYGWREIMGTAAVVADRQPTYLRVSPAALYAMASAAVLLNYWRRGPGMLTFGKVTELTYLDWGVRPAECAGRASAIEFNLLSGFRQTFGWYRSMGWL